MSATLWLLARHQSSQPRMPANQECQPHQPQTTEPPGRKSKVVLWWLKCLGHTGKRGPRQKKLHAIWCNKVGCWCLLLATLQQLLKDCSVEITCCCSKKHSLKSYWPCLFVSSRAFKWGVIVITSHEVLISRCGSFWLVPLVVGVYTYVPSTSIQLLDTRHYYICS